MTELENNIYMEEIPLPGSPLKALNCFFLRGTERNLVVDVGFDTEEGKGKIRKTLRELDFAPEKTDLFLTHMHEDHIGAMMSLRREGLFPRVYISGPDAAYHNAVRREGLQVSILRIARLSGFSDEEGWRAYQAHPASRLSGGLPPAEFDLVKEGDVLDLGGLRLTVREFPGHTMGLCGLYEERLGYLFAGDHILSKISPNITFWREDFDALGEYLKSLEKARALRPTRVFSAHRFLPPDGEARIAELLAHHERRLREVAGLLRRNGPGDARTVAAGMHWDYGGGDFRHFAMNQVWFATGEALAHLEHLRFRGDAERTERNGAFLYSISQNSSF